MLRYLFYIAPSFISNCVEKDVKNEFSILNISINPLHLKLLRFCSSKYDIFGWSLIIIRMEQFQL